MKSTRLRFCLALLLAVVASASLYAAPNRKFFQKAAEKVWKSQNEMFNPAREIPDGLTKSNSAIILADYMFVDAGHESYENIHGAVNRMKRTGWTRRMIKLLDAKAVEDFSEFEFGERSRIEFAYHTFGATDNAFGARIHKPDGTVVDVDINEAFDVTEGKKDVVSHKIAIPGLEPGDVLEYFEYTEEWIDELDLPSFNIVPFDKYPVLEYLFEGEFAPTLTVEYRVFNGAPEPQKGVTEKGNNALRLNIHNIEVVKDRKYLRKYRQLPFVRVSTLNNTSKYRYYPRSLRGGGLYSNLPTGK